MSSLPGQRAPARRNPPATRASSGADLEVVEKHVAIEYVVVYGGRPTAQEGHRAKRAGEIPGWGIDQRQRRRGGIGVEIEFEFCPINVWRCRRFRRDVIDDDDWRHAPRIGREGERRRRRSWQEDPGWGGMGSTTRGSGSRPTLKVPLDPMIDTFEDRRARRAGSVTQTSAKIHDAGRRSGSPYHRRDEFRLSRRAQRDTRPSRSACLGRRPARLRPDPAPHRNHRTPVRSHRCACLPCRRTDLASTVVSQILTSTRAFGPTESSPFVRSPITTPLAVKVEAAGHNDFAAFYDDCRNGLSRSRNRLARLSRCRRHRRAVRRRPKRFSPNDVIGRVDNRILVIVAADGIIVLSFSRPTSSPCCANHLSDPPVIVNRPK